LISLNYSLVGGGGQSF